MIVAWTVIGALAFALSVKLAIMWHANHVRDAEDAEIHAAFERSQAPRPLTADERTRLRALAPTLHTIVDGLVAPFAAATSPNMLAALAPGDASCPFAVHADTRVTRVRKGAPVIVTDFDVYRAEATIAALDVAAGAATLDDLDVVDMFVHRDLAVIFVVTSVDTPPLLGPNGFDPGHIAGTAYAYDVARGAIACAGDVDVRSGDHIDFEYETRGDGVEAVDRHIGGSRALERDLDERLHRAIHGALHAVGSQP